MSVRVFPAATRNALLKLFYSSLLAGVGVAVIFSLAIYGVTRSSDMRRAQRPAAATAFAMLAAVGLVLCGAMVVYGLYLVAHKG
jgi:uncharacterized membrane protein YidH (DUF202 family)